MATAPDAPRNASLVEHGSPDLSITPSSDNIPAITQDEVIRAGTVAGGDQPVKKKKAPPANGGIKKKQKKKVPPPALGSDSRVFYDIHNLIIARDDYDLSRLGILPQTAPLSGNTKKVAAPVPDRMTVSGQHVSRTMIFCPECGLRVEKHGERIVDDGPDHYVLLVCPDD